MLLKLMMQFLNGMLNMITMTKDELIAKIKAIQERNPWMLCREVVTLLCLYLNDQEINDALESINN